MMSRRKALKLGGASTISALAATTTLAASCSPTPALAAVHDPMLMALRKYRSELRSYDEARSLSDDEAEAVIDATFGPFFKAGCAGTLPPLTTHEGAVECIRTVLGEKTVFDFERHLLQAALAFLEGRT